MTRLVLFLAVVLAGAPTYAEPLQISLGSDIYHAPGLSSWSLRYGDEWGVRAGMIVMPTTKVQGKTLTEPVWLAGVDHQWKLGNWRLGLGAVRISSTTMLNGTLWNFDLSAQYRLGGGAFLEFRHYSHGSALGIADDKSNRGWNFFGIGYEWK